MTTPETTQKRKPQKRVDLQHIIASYKHDPRMTKPQRIAHFLDWAALRAPKQYFPHNIILKAIEGYAHTPRPKTEEVVSVARSMTTAKRILVATYRRECHYMQNLGVRASVDDNDATKFPLASRARRFVAAKRAMDKTASIINPAKLGAEERAYFNGVTDASRQITDTRIKALLGPRTEDKK